MAGSITEVTDNSFPVEVLESDSPFWSTSGPRGAARSRVVAPEINGEREDLRVVKLNVDDNQQTAARFEVLSIPTLILLKAGRPVRKVIGAYPKKRFEAELEPAVAA